MKILGISAYYHDSAACLIDNGKIICAAQEERFSRVKHDPAFPVNAINFCIKFSRIKNTEIDYIVFYDKPFVKFERIFETYLSIKYGIHTYFRIRTIFINFSTSIEMYVVRFY